MKSHLTNCGMPGIADVPYGTHICHFYSSGDNLRDGLTPFFLAGIRSNELCIWVASPPLSAFEVRTEISKFPEMEKAVESGQLRIFDHLEWYGELSEFKADECIQKWLTEESRSMASGYEGLRITGNTSFVPRSHWASLMKYEQLLHDGLRGRRILTCCSYHRDQCRPIDILETVQRHHAVLDWSDGQWQFYMPESSLVGPKYSERFTALNECLADTRPEKSQGPDG